MVSESVSGTMDAKQSMKDDKQKQSRDSGDDLILDDGVVVARNGVMVSPRASDTSCARVLERLQSAAKARPFKLVFVEADAAAQWAGRLQ